MLRKRLNTEKQNVDRAAICGMSTRPADLTDYRIKCAMCRPRSNERARERRAATPSGAREIAGVAPPPEVRQRRRYDQYAPLVNGSQPTRPLATTPLHACHYKVRYSSADCAHHPCHMRDRGLVALMQDAGAAIMNESCHQLFLDQV